MGKQERKAVSVEMKQLLYTLVNSVKKHLEDDDEESLKRRIEGTVKGLITLAEDLKMKGYPKTAAFIRSNAKFMVTFAKLKLKNIRIPYTSNVIERLLRKIGAIQSIRQVDNKTSGDSVTIPRCLFKA
jgi:transposase-like protein